MKILADFHICVSVPCSTFYLYQLLDKCNNFIKTLRLKLRKSLGWHQVSHMDIELSLYEQS